jgi:hypothetical protein
MFFLISFPNVPDWLCQTFFSPTEKVKVKRLTTAVAVDLLALPIQPIRIHFIGFGCNPIHCQNTKYYTRFVRC